LIDDGCLEYDVLTVREDYFLFMPEISLELLESFLSKFYEFLFSSIRVKVRLVEA
jgi:hypothetical protein